MISEDHFQDNFGQGEYCGFFKAADVNDVPSALLGASEGSIPMSEQEELHIIELDQGDGWTRVRRIHGPFEEGFVPTTYIESTLYNTQDRQNDLVQYILNCNAPFCSRRLPKTDASALSSCRRYFSNLLQFSIAVIRSVARWKGGRGLKSKVPEQVIMIRVNRFFYVQFVQCCARLQAM